MSDRPLGGKVQLDTTEFKNGIATINRELRLVESEFRAGAAALGDWGKSADGLTQRIGTLNSKIDLQKEKVEATRRQYELQAQATGESSREADEMRIRLNKEVETLGKMESELRDNQTALDEMGKESAQAGEKVEDLGEKEEKTKRKTLDLKGAMGALKGAVSLAVGALAGLAAAAVGAVAGISGAVFSAADMAGELVDLSAQTGISVTRLQELKYAGDQLGVSTETVTGAMAKMIKSMSKADTKEMAEAFDALGVATTDNNGVMKDSEVMFSDLLRALGKVENETERDALAMEIFGKSAQDLNPLIKAGGEELAALSAEAHKVGAVVGEDNVMALEGFGDQMASMKAGLQGTLATVASEFLPIMQQLATSFQTWLQDPATKQGLADLVAWLGTNLPIAMAELGKFWEETLQPALKAVWEIMVNDVIPALSDAWDWLEKNLPPAIEALGKLWEDTLQPALETVWKFIQDNVIPILEDVYEWLETNLPPTLEALSKLWDETLKPAIEAVWKFISDNLIPLFVALVDVHLASLSKQLEAVSTVWNTVLKPAFEAIWGFLSKNLNPILEKAAGWVGGLLEKFGGLEGIIKSLIGWLENLKNKINETPSTLPGGGNGGGYPGVTGKSGALPTLPGGSSMVPVGAGVNVNVYATVSGEMDLYRLAQVVAAEIQRITG